MSADAVTGCTDPDPRVRLRQLSWRAGLLVDVEERTGELVRLGDGRVYEGPGPVVAAAREAAGGLEELAALHAGDDLGDPAAVADLDESLATAVVLVRRLEAMSAPGGAADA
ncbi:hypothetical protein [Streptomyces yaizuensis]|uniref:PqqD family protein n=1 Tax=Streptomyces yaizuensis TaxID=2989713 RepID=A0ABQ5P629_9ACTN|nr:hypothetical protein [Streptomyces sp. YSPA8]GLF98024.1 hypothetical protein SYYSPA8_27025 [Streptomyces sp. YSPA8]